MGQRTAIRPPLPATARPAAARPAAWAPRPCRGSLATYTNGQALTDLAGYRIYYGTSVNDLSRTILLTSVGIQSYVIDNLTTGTWYFGISAITNTGVESALSDIVSKTIG